MALSSAFNASSRTNMTIHVSHDGLHWCVAATVYEGPSAYSAMVALNSTAVGLLYERDNYASLTFEPIDLSMAKCP